MRLWADDDIEPVATPELVVDSMTRALIASWRGDLIASVASSVIVD